MKNHIYLGLLVGLLIMSCGGAKTADELWQYAQENADNRQYGSALTALNRLIENFPDSPLIPRAQFQIADLYLNGTGEMEKAVEAFAVTAEQFPDMEFGLKSLFMMGFVQSNYLQDYENARLSYEKFLERYPNDELITSVEFELANLGKGVDEIESLRGVINGE
ncbi:MAG: tetratricopeptide repeat protein [Candidatus Marinimicrobia bacterium]|nr:tetratricopeptide repeat protein [Candidatus Neomarinimicrobiota bacterium]